MPIAENMQAKRDNRHFKADVSIDLKNFFDTVDRKILTLKLKGIGND